MVKNILIIGNGAYGVALSQVLINNKNNVFIFSKNLDTGEKIMNGEHDAFKGMKLNTPLKSYSDYESAFSNKIDIIILCVPSIAINSIFNQIKQYLNQDMIIVNTSKGLNDEDNSIWSKLFLKNSSIKHYCLLVGPSFASEIVLKNKTIVNIVSKEKEIANQITDIFNNDYFKLIYFNDEYIASLVSSFKNSLALALGLINYYTSSTNTIAAYLTMGINEIQAIIAKITNCEKIKILDFFGLGDIYLTCTSDESRNYQFGYSIAEKGLVKTIDEMGNNTVEGFRTLKLISEYIKEYKLNSPIFTNLYKICYENHNSNSFIDDVWKEIN